jgi:hypothetical protein
LDKKKAMQGCIARASERAAYFARRISTARNQLCARRVLEEMKARGLKGAAPATRECISGAGIIFITVPTPPTASPTRKYYTLCVCISVAVTRRQALRYAPRSTRVPGRLHAFEIDALMSENDARLVQLNSSRSDD